MVRFKGRVTAMVAALVLGLMGVLGTTPAHANEIDAVVPGSLKMTRVDNLTDPVHLWSEVKLTGEWRVADFSAKKGDTFSVAIPDMLAPLPGGFGFEGADGTSFGDCAVNGQKLTCTLNENVENRANVHGTFWLRSQIVKKSDQATVPVTVRGNQIVNVSWPNGEPGVGIDSFVPWDILKEGWVENDNALVWRVIIPGSKIADRSVVNIADDYTLDGLPFTVTPGYPHAYTVNNTAECWNEEYIPNCRTQLDETTSPKAVIKVNEADTSFTAELNNNGQNFDPNKIYVVALRLQTTSKIQVGAKYVNKANVDGVEVNAEAKRNAAGGGTGSGDGVGHLSLAKTVSGAAVPAATEFTVKYSYTVDGTLKSGELKVKNDGTPVELNNIPNGTVVTLTEDPAAAADVTFGDPVFSGNGVTDGGANDASATVKITEFTTVAVELNNPATPNRSKVVPVSPKITPGVCEVGSTTPTEPTVNVPSTDGITYSTPVLKTEGNVVKVSLTATPAAGRYIDDADLPQGWTKNADGTATFSGEVTQPNCAVEEVSPVAPQITWSTCPVGSKTPVPTTAQAPTTAGITYTNPVVSSESGTEKVTMTAKTEAGKVFPAQLGEGWTRVSDSEATFMATAPTPPCGTTTVTPSNPVVKAGVCQAGSSTPSEPVVETPSVSGLDYGTPKIMTKDGKVTVTVVVTPQAGHVIGDLPQGWTKNADGTATYTWSGDQATCEPGTTPPSQPEQSAPVTPKKKLPKTGN
ncbi:DUF5979 domain-containing protein [Propionibacterium sp. oral taxon 192]|uniref:DUF5979 domain-containing protein n=1 Tax=Propionibacterium sp. oral taxon 192 TaxID=671222 RepID=UPI0012EC430D|nr:DUF5979 domain-containing protein [Propionibacterium sp. oral taxon 192]